jgi:Uma2 family endonuclease
MALPEQVTVSREALSNLLGNVIAVNVSVDEYMETYAGEHCEYVEGFVIKMSPGDIRHNDLIYYLHTLLRTYFKFRPLGRVVGQPFVLRLPAFPNRRREPDLIVVLRSNPNRLTNTYMDGPADICIEVVSNESHDRDYREKFIEYEQGGVPEYWIIDSVLKDTVFYRLNSEGRYVPFTADHQGLYRTPALPGFSLHVPSLWGEEPPDPIAIVDAVRAMLADS